MVPIYHVNLARRFSKDSCSYYKYRGVSNATVIKSYKSFIGFDIGPGNGPIDKIVSSKLNLVMIKKESYQEKEN